MEALLYAAGAVTILLGALAGLWQWMGRPVAGLIRGVREFLSDWQGEPARPGVPPRRGVMERLATMEEQNAGLDRRLARVEDTLARAPVTLRTENGR